MMDEIRRNIDPFQEEDDRSVFVFLQQIAPLACLPQKKAAEVLVEELLSSELQQGLPKPVLTLMKFAFTFGKVREPQPNN